MSFAVAAGATQHRQNTALCLWGSPAWLHSSPWSVGLDSGEKDEMWVSCWDALHRLEAPVPLCFFYCHLISFPPFSEVQRRNLLHTREADKVLKGLQTFLYLSALETKTWLGKENSCLDVKLPSQYWKKPNQLISPLRIWWDNLRLFSFPAQLLIAYMQFCCNTNLSDIKNPVFCYLIWWLMILNR